MRRTLKDFKKLIFKPVKAGINRIDFFKLMEYLARFEPGRSWMERTGDPSPAFSDQEEIIQHTIELTKKYLDDQEKKVSLKEIEEYARSISCRYDYDVHRFGKPSIFNLLAHLWDQEDLDRIFVSEDRRELQYIDTLQQARKDGLGVVYLINHSSHWDEFIVVLVLEQLGIQMPLFAAGSNMMATPSLERVLMTGSYLIVRRGATKTYLSTLFNYCRALAELGKQQGIFLEAWSGGARTRDGSLRYPRRLVALQGAVTSDKDVLIQPVVISYGAVPEDLSLSERAGARCWVNGMKFFRNWLKRPHRPLTALAKGAENIYGRAFIKFSRPRLLSELDQMRAQDPADLSLDEFVALYSMREIARDKKIMASHLAARGLIRALKEETSDLVSSTQAELDDLVEYHRRTFNQDPDLEDFILKHDMEDVVMDGLKTLAQRKIINKAGLRSRDIVVHRENALLYYATHGDRRLYSPSAKENIVVVGSGAWGYGMACLIGHRTLEDKRFLNSSLMLYDPREELISQLIDTRVHPVHFPKLRLPKNVFPSSDITAAFRKANEVIITTSIDFFETDLRRLLAVVQQPINLVIATRGFDRTTHRLPIQIAQDILEETEKTGVSLMVLSGPITPANLAKARGGTLVLAGSLKPGRHFPDLFNTSGYDVYHCTDPIGVQLAGTMVEIYTLLGTYLLRTKSLVGKAQVAAFIRETSDEVMRMAVALGGKKETFLPENPAWTALYVAVGMGGPSADFGRQAGRSLQKARQSAAELLQDSSRDQREEEWYLIGYTGIRSAYLTAKRLGLEMPRLRQAYRLFWKD